MVKTRTQQYPSSQVEAAMSSTATDQPVAVEVATQTGVEQSSSSASQQPVEKQVEQGPVPPPEASELAAIPEGDKEGDADVEDNSVYYQAVSNSPTMRSLGLSADGLREIADAIDKVKTKSDSLKTSKNTSKSVQVPVVSKGSASTGKGQDGDKPKKNKKGSNKPEKTKKGKGRRHDSDPDSSDSSSAADSPSPPSSDDDDSDVSSNDDDDSSGDSDAEKTETEGKEDKKPETKEEQKLRLKKEQKKYLREMKNAKFSKVSLETLHHKDQFDGTYKSYLTWSARMKGILSNARLQTHITEKQPPSRDKTVRRLWLDRDDQAKTLITMNIKTGIQLPVDVDEVTCYQLWRKLKRLYLSQQKSASSGLRQQLNSLRKSAFKTVDAYVNELHRLRRELTLLKKPVQDDDFLDILLAGIADTDPRVVDLVKSQIDIKKVTKKTYYMIFENAVTLLMEHEKLKPPATPKEEGSSKQSKTDKKKNKKNSSNEDAESKEENPPAQMIASGTSSNSNSSNSQNQNSRGRGGWRGGRGRGRGRGGRSSYTATGRLLVCYNCGKIGHHQSECRSNPNPAEVQANRQLQMHMDQLQHQSFRPPVPPPHFGAPQIQYAPSAPSQMQTPHPPPSVAPSHSVSNFGFLAAVLQASASKPVNDTSGASAEPILIDSGASFHCFKDASFFIRSEPTTKTFLQADGTSVHPKAQGTVQLFIAGQRFLFIDALLVPDCPVNLLSAGRLALVASSISKAPNSSAMVYTFKASRPLEFTAYHNPNHLLFVDASRVGIGPSKGTFTEPVICTSAGSGGSTMDVNTWHAKLGHPSNEVLRKASKAFDFKLSPADLEECKACRLGKATQLPFNGQATIPATRPLMRVHADLKGPYPVKGINNELHYLIAVDEFSRFIYVICLKTKGDAIPLLLKWFKFNEQNGLKLQYFRSDMGSEFLANDIQAYFKEKGVVHELSAPYSPQQNGMAERANRKLGDRLRTFLASNPSLPVNLWPYLILSAAILLNSIPCKAIGYEIPMFRMFGQMPSIQRFKAAIGSTCYVVDPGAGPLEPKGVEGILIGFDGSTNYLVWLPAAQKLVRSHHVRFSKLQVTSQSEANSPIAPGPRKPPRVRKPRHVALLKSDDADADAVDYQSVYLHAEQKSELGPIALASVASEYVIPQTYKQAIQSPERLQWEASIDRELNSLLKNKVLEGVHELPPGKRALDTKWVFKIKPVDLFKSRLVVRGFEQVYGSDYTDTFAPVSRLPTLRLLLALASVNQWSLSHADVETAFLHGTCTEEIYIERPEGVKAPFRYFRVVKNLYGLKQAPLVWYTLFSTTLVKLGFVASLADPCLFHKKDQGYIHHVLIYVDDILIASPLSTFAAGFISSLNQYFTVKHLGFPSSFLNIQIKKTEHGITLGQANYIDAVLERFGMQDAHPVDAPAAQSQGGKKSTSSSPNSTKSTADASTSEVTSPPLGSPNDYAAMVGCLLYLALATRWDILWATQQASQKIASPTTQDLAAVKRILRFLKGSKSLTMLFPMHPPKTSIPIGYSDADFASPANERKSVSGCMFTLFGTPFIWICKKQSKIALNTQEAELTAAVLATKEALWLRKFIFFAKSGPIAIHVDNQPALQFIQGTNRHARTKHYEIELFWLQDINKSSCDGVQYKQVSSANQLADCLTKAFNGHSLKKLYAQLNMSR